MSLKLFESHLHVPAPGFNCYASRGKSNMATFLARVSNCIEPPGSKKALSVVTKLYGGVSAPLKQFVELHDGVLLYSDTNSDAAGIEFFKTAEWQSKTDEMRESISSMGFDLGEMPEWFQCGVVFAEIPFSGNYFVLQHDGDEAGQIFYCDHDDFKAKPMAESFELLLAMIVSDPPGFLYKCGCYTRYSDGKSDIQWIPKEFVSDCEAEKAAN
jgi:SMI1 / KNR4 family (SUKH-1)